MTNSSHPQALALEAGTHALCTCGLSKNGAFCDGSHQGSGKTPYLLQLDEPTTIYRCNCGATGNSPFCDGSHTRLTNPAAAGTRQRPWWQFWN
jgi:CDGSH-type Zn-finger protein